VNIKEFFGGLGQLHSSRLMWLKPTIVSFSHHICTAHLAPVPVYLIRLIFL